MTDDVEQRSAQTEAPPPESEPSWGTRLRERVAPASVDWTNLVLIPFLAVFTALVIGAVIIALTDGIESILPAYQALFSGAFLGLRSISETLLAATPVILAGLSVAVGFRAGLFNIGVEGQMVMGGLAAVIVGFSFEGLPMILHLPLALLGGLAAGAVYGGIPGLLKAKTGAHEVITTIMLNWISFNFLVWALKTPFIQREGRADPISKDVLDSARLPKLLGWVDPQLRVHFGFILALLVAWFVYWLLFKSSIGFEFRAVGANPHGARYAGMSVTLVTISVMALAGALAGLGGSGQTLGELGRASPGFTGGFGFTAIALALLGRSHPLGVVLAGLLFGALTAGGRTMQAQAGVGIDLITIVQGLIILFVAAPELIKAIYRVRGKVRSEQITAGWGA